MRGLELRKGTVDIVLNDVAPDIVYQLEKDPHLQIVETPGVDYQYVGVNLRDPILEDVRVRQALAYAIDRHAIVDYLRRGLAGVSTGILPPLSWAYAPDSFVFPHDPAKARALLDEAGYPDPDGDGPRPRLTLTLKTTNTEFNRLQSAFVQQNLRDIGVELDVRTYEFATLYADVLGRELSALLPAVDWRIAGRSRHSAARVSFEPGPAGRFQPRALQQSRSRPTARRGERIVRRSPTARAVPAGATPRRARPSVHQPLVQDEFCGRTTVADRRAH